MQEQSQVSLSRKRPSKAKRDNTNTLLKFSQQVLNIPEVIQVSICESDNNPDVFVIYNSKQKDTRFKIYDLAQSLLLTDLDNPMDFHTINLDDYEKNKWESIIPHETFAVYKKVTK